MDRSRDAPNIRLLTPRRLSVDDLPYAEELATRLTEELLVRSRSSGPALLVSIVIMWVIGGVPLRQVHPTIELFFGLYGLLVVLRLVAVHSLGARNARTKFVVFLTLTTLVGISWGALVTMLYLWLDPTQLAILYVCVTAVESIAILSMAPSPTCYAAYTGWAMLSFIGLSFVVPVPGMALAFQLMGVGYALALVRMLGVVHGSLRSEFLLGFRFRDAAQRDALTQLRNRRFLIEHLPSECARVLRSWPREPRSFAIMIIDIDHFKSINDTHGHAAGDAVLKQMAAALQECARRTDMVVRWGGEEFVIVAFDVDREAQFPLPERIQHRVATHPFRISSSQRLSLTCSIGWSFFPFLAHDSGAHDWESVLHLADEALYAAKRGGRNCAVQAQSLSPEMQRKRGVA